jgi:hypothetical protein
VPRTRLELAHRNRHQPLKLACLPISPSGHETGILGAQNRTRTCTSLLTLVPETSASTNFAIWAFLLAAKNNKNMIINSDVLIKIILLLPDKKTMNKLIKKYIRSKKQIAVRSVPSSSNFVENDKPALQNMTQVFF